MERKYSRSRKAWHPNEIKRVRLLLANGYEREEVAQYLDRPPAAISGLLCSLETSQKELQGQRGLSKREKMLREPLPQHNPEILYRAVEVDFPHLSLTPPRVSEISSTEIHEAGVALVDYATNEGEVEHAENEGMIATEEMVLPTFVRKQK